MWTRLRQLHRQRVALHYFALIRFFPISHLPIYFPLILFHGRSPAGAAQAASLNATTSPAFPPPISITQKESPRSLLLSPSSLIPENLKSPPPCSPKIRPFSFPVLYRSSFRFPVSIDVGAMSSILPKNETVQIREVWSDNLEQEFVLIREIVDDFPFVAMDTEFPGIVCRPLGNFRTSSDFNYATLKANVDMLKLIQLGLTFSDENGSLPTCGTDRGCVWQFNFREFDIQRDVFASDSIELLRQSGIDFKKNNEKGIDTQRFGELLMSSGIVLNDSVHWVTFHSGYDFGYLLKLLTCQNLPDTQAGFFNLIKIYFPTVYDIKHLMKFCNSLHGGLNKLAELLDVERVGICHQAGSDSLLTSCAFRKLKESFFNGSTEKYAGVLYGLGVENGQTAH
ncbi:hypothetical protein BHM03_00001940 [Ensete ventricosum]|uniref:poly(A)-specific ribonuclease n=2 Tax=Ensete ventricosum TaxID=4639 RepID=A0A445M9C8_ENSVE|nr:hypothetical protein BHM03_00001940 [Ensete ventricosum]